MGLKESDTKLLIVSYHFLNEVKHCLFLGRQKSHHYEESRIKLKFRNKNANNIF